MTRGAQHIIDKTFLRVAAELQVRSDALPRDDVSRRAFLSTYRRTTLAVGDAAARGDFVDPLWVADWDRVFAHLFLSALDADLANSAVPRPWKLAFHAPSCPTLLTGLLLQLNSHINYDLPQALIAVIRADEFDDPLLLERRRGDHQRIERVLAAQVAREDRQLGLSRHSIAERLLAPVNRLSSRHFLRQARMCVWHNARQLDAARSVGPLAYSERLSELEVLASAKVAELLRPGQVLIRLALSGFGVRLPPLA